MKGIRVFMQWNQLDYETQRDVMQLIENSIEGIILPEILHTGLKAAILELDMWSNSPCQGMDVVEANDYIVEE